MIHSRYLRYRTFDRLRYSKKFLEFLSAQATRLAGLTSGAVTFDNTTNTLTQVDHIYVVGSSITLSTDTTLPAELDDTTVYYVGSIVGDAFSLYPTEQDAIDETNVVTFTDDGTGTHTTTSDANQETIFNLMRDFQLTAEQVATLDTLYL